MVQKKGMQKAKQKSVIATPTSRMSKKTTQQATAPPSKVTKKAKAAPLSNGYGDHTKTKLDIVEPAKSAEDISTAVEGMKVSEPEASKSNQPGTSKELEESATDKPEVKQSVKSTSQPLKSLKRKGKSEEGSKDVDKNVLVKRRTKAKAQKVVLEVPSLSSLHGKVFVVGQNDVGQLGLDEDIECKERPFLLELPYSIVDVAAGGMHSVCLTENGEVITFGCNDEGALGRVASEEEERIPRRVDIPERIVQVSAGDSHSAALAESGQVYIWGNFRNGDGPMGLTPDGQKRIAPLKVLHEITMVKIASGGDHFVCLSNKGVVYTCGCGEQGQLGRVNIRTCHDGGRKGIAVLLEPAPVERLAVIPVNDVWTESYATFLKAEETGSIYAFGLNNYNQLGFENKVSQMKYFPEVSFHDKSWQQISGGQHHTLALDEGGFVYALGRKDYGRLGLGQNCEDTTVPTIIPTLQNEKCSGVSCGNCVSFAITEQGSLYSWGMGSSQLGHGDEENEEDIHVPRQISGEFLNSWQVYKISGGGQHSLILAYPKATTSKNKKT